ncbi:MAG: hypothetical protein KJ060_03620 [Candidatus Hydrogenedentes bacterium]|nr:hypothetical protein [Candidatus Hydrogenedentota bacterium]
MDTVSVRLLSEDGLDQLVRTLGLGGVCMLVLTSLTVLIAVKLGSILAALWFDSRYPELSDAMLHVYRNDPMRCVIVGLFNIVAGVILAIILLSTEVLALFGIALMLALIVFAYLGYAVGYRSAGVTIPLPARWDNRPGALILGGLVIEGAFFVPILGQLLSLATKVRGFGAVTLALIARRRKEPVIHTAE